MSKQVRKITTTGATGTYYVTLPKEAIKDLGWRKGQRVTVKKTTKGLLIEDYED